MRVTCNECQFSGSLAAVALHSCQIQQQGGRCEDYPCCGHTDGDGCQTLPEHTSAFWLENPRMLYDREDPEFLDYMAALVDDDEPDREPDAEQERAWDERDDEIRGHALDPIRAQYG